MYVLTLVLNSDLVMLVCRERVVILCFGGHPILIGAESIKRATYEVILEPQTHLPLEIILTAARSNKLVAL